MSATVPRDRDLHTDPEPALRLRRSSGTQKGDIPMNTYRLAAVLFISALTLFAPTEGRSMSAFADDAFWHDVPGAEAIDPGFRRDAPAEVSDPGFTWEIPRDGDDRGGSDAETRLPLQIV
jgi:hypothetical protein